jgi:hypothetical protein
MGRSIAVLDYGTLKKTDLRNVHQELQQKIKIHYKPAD